MIGRQAEAKVRLIRNKLLGLYDGDIEIGKDLTLEDIIDRIGVRLVKAKRTEYVQQQMEKEMSHYPPRVPQVKQNNEYLHKMEDVRRSYQDPRHPTNQILHEQKH